MSRENGCFLTPLKHLEGVRLLTQLAVMLARSAVEWRGGDIPDKDIIYAARQIAGHLATFADTTETESAAGGLMNDLDADLAELSSLIDQHVNLDPGATQE